jgi:diguanylate cyclase (GGDEF)-like protein
MVSYLIAGAALVIVAGLTLRLAMLRQKVRTLHRQLSSAEILACTDTLTGLANRGGLHRALTGNLRSGAQVAVLLFDLDRLKSINDEHGHAAGDTVLVEIAHRIIRQSAAVVSAARLGGDEYVVVLATQRNTNISQYAEEYARALQRAISAPIVVDDVTLRVRASIGIAVLPSADADQLLAAADQAMYRAKYTGAGICRYHPTIDGAAPVTPAPRSPVVPPPPARRQARVPASVHTRAREVFHHAEDVC